MDRDGRHVTRRGPGLFKIPVDGGVPVRLVSGQAVNPVWSPDGKLIVYGGKFFTGQVAAAWRATGWHACRVAVCANPPGRLSLPAQWNGLGVSAVHSIIGFLAVRFRHERLAVSSHASAIRALCGPSTSRLTGNTSCSTARAQNSDIVLIDLPK